VLANPTETLAAVQAMASAQLLQSSDQVSAFVASLSSGDIVSPNQVSALVASLSSGDFSPIAALTAALSSSDLLAEAATPLHLAAIAAVALGSSLNLWLSAPDDYVKIGAPYLPGTTTYSPASSESFYADRPFLVAKRVLKLATLTSAFNTGILFDWLVLGKLFKDEEYTALKNAEPERAKVALKLAEQLGPTFIKLGQALSIREDIIPSAYALELRSLQDAVPPFDSATAYDVLRKELGVTDLNEVFSELSAEPVASASIGQVYKGKLRSNGKTVAVKIQRPGILSEIALDLHVLRILTPIQTTLQNAANGVKTSQDDIDTAVALVDEWGRGFVAETDYRLEALNTVTFEKAMRERGLDAVCAPTVVEEYTRDKVLLTEWVDGTRLDSSQSPDVPRLCGVAINAYLTMLLDTGVLHCDPHPGNLLRTNDGRLCILDWGMTLSVPNDLQYALLEFIAHINTQDFEALPQDFINLGFSPPDVSLERLQNSGITEGLAFAFRQLSQGGGPKKIQERVKAEFQERYGSDLSDEELRLAARADMMEQMEAQLEKEGVDVKGVTNVMEEMSRRNRELFALPPYVLYVARAFSTLEGIGLSVDEDYAIVQECFPYLARRLFTDRSPRAKKALRAMLGLAEDADDATALAAIQAGARGEEYVPPTKKEGALSPGKLIEMSEGFASYTAATADVDRDGAGQAAAAAEFSKLLLDPKGSTLQEILVEETARLGDAATRRALRQILVDNPAARAFASTLQTPKDILERSEQLRAILPGPFKEALVDRPAALPELIMELVELEDNDERLLANAQELSDALGPRIQENVDIRGAFSSQLADGASGVPSLPDVRSLIPDSETRRTISEALPGVATLGRRVGAGLLRRAAYRSERAPGIPDNARKILADTNKALADAVCPDVAERNAEAAASEER